MNFEFSDASMTLLAGAYAMICVVSIARYVFAYRVVARLLRHFPRTKDGSVHAAAVGVLAAGVCFAVGLLVEDACYKAADRFAFWPYHWTHHKQYSSDHEHSLNEQIETRLQQAALFENVAVAKPKETPLGEAVIQSKIFRYVLGDAGKEVEDWSATGCLISTDGTKSRDATRQDRISRVFFFAKNRVYTDDNYFDELRYIDRRQEFSSTIATLSLVAVLVVFVGSMTRRFMVPWPDRFVKLLARRVVIITGIFVAIYVLAFAAFLRESEEFNRRAFGYYDSMLRSAEVAESWYKPPAKLP